MIGICINKKNERMKKMKTKMIRFLVSCMLISAVTNVYADDQLPNIRLNNYVVDFKDDQAAEVIDGELFVPVRKIGELCHFDVSWEDNYAIIRKDDDEFKLSALSENVIINGKEEKLHKRPVILAERMLISVEDAKNIYNLYYDIDQFEGETALHQKFKFDDEKFYCLVTTFIGDPKTQRGFAWEAELEYNDMVLQYKKENETDDKLIEIIPTCEKQGVLWANNVTYDEVPLSVYDAGNYKEVYDKASIADYKLFYKANITDLEPGTKYSYRIGSKLNNEFSEFYTFETESEKTEAFSIIGVTDPQGRTFDEYMYYKETLNKALEECPNPAFIINAGDMTDNAYYDDWWRYFFEASEGTCETIPLMTAVGNHEERGDGVKYYNYHFNNPQNAKGLADNFVPSETTDKTALPCIQNIDNTVYSFDYGNAHFAVVNSGSDWGTSKELLDLQTEWLKNDLENSDKKWKIVVTHRGVYVQKIRNQDPKDAFLDILDTTDVDLVIQGHDHTYMRTHKMKNDEINDDGILYALIGSAALKRYDAADNHEWVDVVKPLPKELPNYVVINFDENKISFSAKLIDGTEIDCFEIEK